jgi:stage V sporulation protein B
VVQTTNGLLQGMGRVYVPMISLAVGAAVKITLNYLLVGMPGINIHGAPLGTVACYLVPAAINLAVLRRTGVMRLKGMLLRPALASALMCGGAWALNGWLAGLMPAEAACGVAVAASVPLYMLLSVLTGAIGREELMLLPKGDKISAYLKRRGLLKG